MPKNKKLIVANWKMNPQSLVEAKKLFLGVKKTASGTSNVQTVICPPNVFISELNKLYSGHRVSFGAQDVFWKEKGSYTGEISPEEIKSVGAEYVILGHSEARAFGETNEIVNKKVIASLKAGLNVILCIGESKRDAHALYLKFLTEQLKTALLSVGRKELKNLIVAYEPIWAIGKTDEDAISPHQMHEMYIFIKKTLTELYDKKIALNIPIIYGGSAEPDNVNELLVEGEVDGFLVGHASLEAREFNEILKIANKK
ncbi:MAG: triose-phosphate isomerase [Candidatus Pacebacteria bacterium]|jgi:triosephosphate isomerase|nr:triose-phosphate isomerase [Candidatus Paceibacterota bacterium]MDP7159521.1 triose-phosphate isomerase [Candidatus Paceibacterota bacterium]MDP7366393.1 triose-phosphate isomerase [Candidatus Paceibacterota bacterium]MDP7466377.1 triose-phosphate isomerase [Candidatus Paceibacterota bacterium]MDP7648314.1 triose-phosphate isomerase [Candidatus Paceibacterota bacterium]|tara:strand:- start:10123 stop:10893 length:771 start_codon:yes stop_codon:yes gene_type:complete